MNPAYFKCTSRLPLPTLSFKKFIPTFQRTTRNFGQQDNLPRFAAILCSFLGLLTADAVSGVFDYLDERRAECKPFPENLQE